MKKLLTIFLLTTLCSSFAWANSLRVDVATESEKGSSRIDWLDGFAQLSAEKGYKIVPFDLDRYPSQMIIAPDYGRELGLVIRKTENGNVEFENQTRAGYQYAVIYTLTNDMEDWTKWKTKTCNLSNNDNERYCVISQKDLKDLEKGRKNAKKEGIIGAYDIKIIVKYKKPWWHVW